MTVLQVLLIAVFAPLLHGAMKTLRARLQGRPGPSVLQPYRDLRKLWSKDPVLPEGVSWIVACAPGVSLGVALTLAAAVPLDAGPPAFLDIVALTLILALGRWIVAVAALDTRSGFAGMAASREMTLSALTEPALLLALLGARLSGGPFLVPHGSFSVAGVVALFAFGVVTIAETARIPIDNQETHYELTMIHEGQSLEYSGWHLAVLNIAGYVRQVAFLTIAAGLIAPGSFAALAGAVLFAVFITFVENAFARLRLFEIPQLLTTGILLAAASVAARMV
ncbi:formate hydrogenlyase [Vulcanimicrobium alpinum]|uniref:Formate hydrogenlyase n=1 Tax=Vulcanimicrobium alpinum TaxID=3016050 RepID=A0AAN2CBF8_UNVUL|nr:NADH-quinone oxidoreductase subunit H [Vulcanimicrobium alpinum]BDE07963.1 formate hydrogenlyase [Vulcanimicrobium alpinum]